MSRFALVVDPDARRTRMLTGALQLFQPGYQVVNAPTLERAEVWIDARGVPDLLVVDLASSPEEAVQDWTRSHGVPADRVVAWPDPDAAPSERFAVLPVDGSLSGVLAVIRGLDDRFRVDKGRSLGKTFRMNGTRGI